MLLRILSSAVLPCLPFALHEARECICYFLKLRFADARIAPNKKGVVHDQVCVLQITDYTAIDIFEGRVTQQVAAEEVARLNAVILKKTCQLIAGESRIRPYGYNVAKP